MATVNKSICSMNNGLMTVSFDYDDVSLLVLAFHIINNDVRGYTISATSTANNKNYTFNIAPNSQINQSVPPGASNRLQLSATPSGKLDGVGWSIY